MVKNDYFRQIYNGIILYIVALIQFVSSSAPGLVSNLTIQYSLWDVKELPIGGFPSNRSLTSPSKISSVSIDLMTTTDMSPFKRINTFLVYMQLRLISCAPHGDVCMLSERGPVRPGTRFGALHT